MSQTRSTIKVEGLDCAVEMEALRSAFEGAPGVQSLGFDLIYGTMTVDYDPGITGPPKLLDRVAKAGMNATLLEGSTPAASWWTTNGHWVATGISGLALLTGVVLDYASAGVWIARGLYLLAIAVGGFELFPRAFRGLVRLRFDIHVLMAAAVFGALALGQWDEAATVAFLFGLSEALEALSLERAKRAVRSLLEIAPEHAEVLGPDGQPRVIPVGQVKAGDRIHVRAGERIPIDGVILSGRSSVDQKAITGESVPVAREAGDPVFAGTVNGEGSLRVRVAGTGERTIQPTLRRSARNVDSGYPVVS